ncbi:HNH endonuclease [Priestia aryabhattai]|uniref:HNH endonuclease n=1 Tax=Priestia aryabhattai TaxID=412384 RepID=UPI001C8EB887|nr:HNH endonuclease [Priestia aryabhattai]MBY0214557.1 HNH endonuclease [Priestia aryabhattai]
MNYFLVFQNKSYEEERKGGYLWAPQRNKNGQTFHHWTDMTLIKKGDIIFNSFDGKLVSVLTAQANFQEHERPTGLEQLDLWEKDGWLVNVKYSDLEEPLTYKNYMEDILTLQDDKYAPFNTLGRGNTGYLFRVSKDLANFLFERIEGTNSILRKKFQIEDSLQLESVKQIEDELNSVTTLEKTEKETIIKSRIGQSAFKKALLPIEKKCRLCGVKDERFLIASHIKPWSESDNRERLDVNNGLLLCPNHDALFDKRYISFDETGKVMVKKSLDATTKTFLNINENMRINLDERQKIYMKWHREKFLQDQLEVSL